MMNVAFLGTGLLGSGMVEGMLGRGNTVTVWNRTEAKARALEVFGAKVALSPEEAVAVADYVHMALPDDEVIDAIVARFAPRLRPEAVVIDHSTTSPAGAKRRLARADKQGIRFIHAPVFMTPQMCRESKGLMLVSGPAAVFEQARAELAKMTGEVWYLGERPDLAASYKLFGNSMLFVITAGVADVFAMANGLGVTLVDAMSLFSKFQVAGAIPSRGAKMSRGDFSASFELTMARKDMRLMIEAAGGQPLAVLPAIAKRMDEAIAKGHGRDDLGAIAAEVVTPAH
jgi:3-hydroxyisobutyrate dehydrogenase